MPECDHDFYGPVPLVMVPPMVDPDGLEDRQCAKCGVVHRAWKQVWARLDEGRAIGESICRLFAQEA
jgi:hypothetical protein